MTRARDIANFGDGIATADIGDGQVTAGKLNSTLDLTGKTVTLPSGVGGSVLQVVQTVKSSSFTTTSTSFVDITGMSASITPASSSNNILIFLDWSNGVNSGSGYPQFDLERNGTTTIYRGDQDGVRTRCLSNHTIFNADSGSMSRQTAIFLDSPSTTSSTTYQLRGRQTAGNTLRFNLSNDSTNDATRVVTASSITLMEIAG